MQSLAKTQAKCDTEHVIEIAFVIFVGFWLLGYITVPWLPITEMRLFSVNGNLVTVWNVLVFFIYLWFIDLLPTPFRQLATALLIMYSLSRLGVITLTGFPNLVVIALIAGSVIYIFNRKKL